MILCFEVTVSKQTVKWVKENMSFKEGTKRALKDLMKVEYKD